MIQQILYFRILLFSLILIKKTHFLLRILIFLFYYFTKIYILFIFYNYFINKCCLLFYLSLLIIFISFCEDDIFIMFFLASALFSTDSDIRSGESKIFLLSSLKNLMKNLMKSSVSKIEL